MFRKSKSKSHLKEKVTPVYRELPEASSEKLLPLRLLSRRAFHLKNKFNILLFTYEHLAAFVDPHLAMEEVEDCLQ